MGELQIIFEGRRYSFSPGATARIGRSSDNDIIISDTTVSRKHAQITWEASGWVWQNVGQAATLVNGQPVASFPVGQPMNVALSAPGGPALHLVPVSEPVRTAFARPAGAAPPVPPPPQPPSPAFPNVPAQQPPPGFPGPVRPGPVRPGLVRPGLVQPGLVQPGLVQPGLVQPGLVQPGLVQPGLVQPGLVQPGLVQPGPAGYAGSPVPPSMPGYPGYPGAPGYQGAPYPGAPAWAPGHPPGVETGSALQVLFPVSSWLHDRGWRQGLRLLIIPLALLPLIFLAIFSSATSLETPGWAYSIYVAPLWLLAFWQLIKPGQLGKLEIQIAVGVVIWTVIWMRLVTVNINGGLNLDFPGAMGVGFNEEITKALPILIAAMLVLKVRKRKLDPRMWMYMGCVTGLTFGIVEQAFYTSRDIVLVYKAGSNTDAILAILAFAERVFVDGFQHAVWAGIACFFVGIAVNYRKRRFGILALGISIPAVLHGLNDWSAGAFQSFWPPIIVQAFSLLLFLSYTLSAVAIVRNIQFNPAFRGESMIMERFSGSGEPIA